MTPVFSATALTLFPEMFPGPLGLSLAGTALKKGLWSLDVVNIRDFATDKHKTVDDSPYGGGTGMVMKPDIIDAAIESVKPGRVVYFTPRGRKMTQELVQSLKNEHLILLCGRFEGVDQRVIDHHEMLEISLGDFVLSGGEIPAYALLDAIVRLLPGVIGKEDATTQESFSLSENSGRLLEYPHYTRPPLWKGMSVPEVLLSGNHEEIRRWRLEKAREITAARRPDLLKKE